MTHKLYPQRAVKTLEAATCNNQMRVFAFKQITLVNKAELWTLEEVGQDKLRTKTGCSPDTPAGAALGSMDSRPGLVPTVRYRTSASLQQPWFCSGLRQAKMAFLKRVWTS